jgi:hypothetical protein
MIALENNIFLTKENWNLLIEKPSFKNKTINEHYTILLSTACFGTKIPPEFWKLLIEKANLMDINNYGDTPPYDTITK